MNYPERQYYFNELTPTQKALQFIWDMTKVVCISLAIIIPIRYFLIQPFYVKGGSMEPTFQDSEYLIINEIGYRLSDPKRGDVIIFKHPKDPSQYFIKRIIGLPGEQVEIKDGQIFIYSNGESKFILDEGGYLDPEIKTEGNKVHFWTLGSDEFFVLGDNRNMSLDSRSFGPVFRDLIIGKVWVRGWPLNRVTVFGGVQYNTY